MKLPFLWAGLGFSLGIVAEKYWPVPVIWSACGLSVGVLFLWFLRGKKIFTPFFVFSLVCAGILCAKLDARVSAQAVENFASTQRVTLRGVVETLPEVKARGKKTTVSLVLKARSITREENGRRKFHKVRGNVQVFLLQSPEAPQAGDELRLYGKLSVPRTVLNPGEFDFGNFLAQKNIRAVFQSIGKKCVRIVKEGDSLAPARILANTRRYGAALADKLYGISVEAAMVKALVFGLRSDISPEIRGQFMKTGTIHLLAISGMNITMIAGTFYVMFLFLGRGYRTTACLTILIVIFYVGLAGAGIPIRRAGYGAVLVLLATMIGRPSHLLNSLCFAFFAILLGDPQSLWSVGFQLSFLCVLSLIMILPFFLRINAWTLSLGSSLAVLVGTFPVVLYYFNVFSPVSVLANIVAIPLCDAALFTALFALLFSGIPFLNMVLVKISSLIIGASLAWVKCLSAWRWGYWFLERPSLSGLWTYYAIVAMILFFYKKTFRGKRFLISGLVGIWLCVSVSFFVSPGTKEFKLTVLASGRNQLAHARFSNGAEWMLNAGRNFPSDQGEWLIAPYLRSLGIRRLEGILFSDLSKVHTGGLASILRDFPIRYLLYPSGSSHASDEFYAVLRKLSRHARGVQQGDKVLMGAEEMRIIAKSQKGAAWLIASGSWRIIFISQWDSGLFEELLRNGGTEEVHAVFLPAGRTVRGIPEEFLAWLDRTKPLLAVLPDVRQEITDSLTAHRIPYFDLKRVGALSFQRNGRQLELKSFLMGPLGVYSYP